MKIVKERTRLLFTDYTPSEKKYLEDLVASMDNIFMYIDPDSDMMALPTGMETSVKKAFPKAEFVDNSNEYWPYEKIQPVQHNAQPRNQLQIDFINFVLKQSENKQKLAGILSPGTGKEQPNSTPIPTPDGFKLMGDIRPGDRVFGSDGKPTRVINVFPQGMKAVYEITLSDGRTVRCGLKHLWKVYTSDIDQEGTVLITEDILHMYKWKTLWIPAFKDSLMYVQEKLRIISIDYIGTEDSTCIMVDNEDHLYVTENYIITHNTFMACYSAIKIGLRTLIIVPTSSIKKQWADTLVNMFKVDPSRVLMVNRPADFINVKADFVIVSQASLAVLNKTYDLEKIMKDNKFGIKAIDEVQMWFKNIINVDANSKIANNWYLTGTFGRSGDRENQLYHEMFGDLAIFEEKNKKPTIFNQKPGNVYGMKPYINCEMIWMHSGLSPDEIKEVTSSMRYSEREGKWMRFGISVPAYTEKIIPSDGSMTHFLKVFLEVIDKAEKRCRDGKTLILVPTIASCDIVEGYCKKTFPSKNIGTINSNHSQAENDRIKKECDMVISTVASAGTGFDMKGLRKLIVGAQYKSWILADQVSGRLRRNKDEKGNDIECYMYDLVDADIRQLKAWANVRADVLRKKCKSFKVVDM